MSFAIKAGERAIKFATAFYPAQLQGNDQERYRAQKSGYACGNR